MCIEVNRLINTRMGINDAFMTTAIVKKKKPLFMLICLVPEVCVQFLFIFKSKLFSADMHNAFKELLT